MAGSVEELEIDVETGLPKLPNGFFFHFRKDRDGDVRCEIRRGFHIWFSKVIEWDYASAERFDEARMRIMSREVAQKMFTKLNNTNELNRLLGSYPPKTLRK